MNLKNHMLNRNLLWLGSIAIAVNLIALTPPALANCSDFVGSVEVWQTPMQRHFQQLQQREYSWGQARPYGTLSGRRVTLTADFDRLTGAQKQQVLNLLLNTPIFTPEELQAAAENGGMGVGAQSPYEVYASDGRIVSAAYDGCTRFTILTERARYSWYYNSIGRSLPTNFDREGLRNAGQPSWRRVQVSIPAAQERNVRQRFWNRMGYSQTDLWIAWVPEQGYFEINVPRGYDVDRLRQFWSVAPRQYRYLVVDTDGTSVMDANFDD